MNTHSISQLDATAHAAYRGTMSAFVDTAMASGPLAVARARMSQGMTLSAGPRRCCCPAL
jgi:hypothetical protein